MMSIPPSAHRVTMHTAPEINRRIDEEMEARIAYCAAHPHTIERRLAELDREWDIERALETNSATLSLLGLGLGLTAGKRWLLLPLVVQGFFLQHAVQGWCPPLPILRRLGYRTRDEIAEERHALESLLAASDARREQDRRGDEGRFEGGRFD